MPTSRLAMIGLVMLSVFVSSSPGEAHKPITSPYTFTEHVFPILRDRCGSCHANGSVAPMSLLTYEETVPWAESMRIELIAGHMPPWHVDSASSRFRNVEQLKGGELNILMTWAAGGTPRGSEEATLIAPAREAAWRLGEPDLRLRPAEPFTLPANVQEHIEEFTLPTDTRFAQWVRAVDLMPGAPTVVRAATVSIKAASTPGRAATVTREQLLALWLPGDDPVPLGAGAGFLLPPGTELTLRIHYRKNWQNERDAITDRSTVGLYFASGPAVDVRAISLEPSPDEASAARSAGHLSFTRLLEEDVDAIAIYPDPALHSVGVAVHALRPDGQREELIAFRPQEHWARRYWYREPVVLTRGTRLEVRVAFDDEAAWLPPGATPRATPEPANSRLTLNVISRKP